MSNRDIEKQPIRKPAVLLVNTNLIIFDHNRSWMQFVNSETDSVLDRHIFDVVPDAKQQLAPLLDATLSGESIGAATIKFEGGTSLAEWDITVEARLGAQGEVSGILLVINSVTDEQRARRLLESAVEDRTRKLSALYTIANTANDVLSLGEALSRSLEAIIATDVCSTAVINLWDESTATAQEIASINFPFATGKKAHRPEEVSNRLKLCIAQRRTLVRYNAPDKLIFPDGSHKLGFNSAADIPMLAKGHAVGALTIFRRSEERIEAREIDLLEAIAGQLGSIIRSSQLQEDHDRLLLEEERRRLADQLHDAVTQSLYSLTLYAGAIRQFADNGELEQTLPFIEPLQSTAQSALREMRLMLHNLRPLALKNVGLADALRLRLDAVERRANMQGRVITENEIVLPNDIEEQLYYIASEALNNALKHANATEVSVVLKQSADSINMTIHDNGSGFEFDDGQLFGGSGLRTMRERSEKLGGTLTIEPASSGTTITAAIPLSTALQVTA